MNTLHMTIATSHIFKTREKIVANTLDDRMSNNKAQYEGFMYNNNQRRKELELINIEVFFKKVKK